MMRKILCAALLTTAWGLGSVAWAQEAAVEAPAAEAAPEATAPVEAAPAAPVKEKKVKKVEKAEAPKAEAAPAEPAAAEPAAAEPAPAEAAATEAAPAEAAPAEAAAAPAPVPDKADTTFLYIATILVILMTIPGLALFYGGMTRQKNMLSTLAQTFTIFSLIIVLWVIYGYSVAFTVGNPYFGSLDKLFLKGVTLESLGATFSKGVYLPEFSFIIFQATFAAITTSLIAGGYAERMKFSAVLIFSVLWFTISYLPMAHMVWYWDGPDAITDTTTLDTVTANAGLLWQWGALDFAGGTVVHINAGVAGLVAAIILGKRSGYGKVAMPPHSLTMTMIGASLLWVGWFGFNAGSNLEAAPLAALAAFNTLFGTAVAAMAWLFAEWAIKGKPSLLGVVSGAIAGLVAITPACGWVGPIGAFWICLVAALVCFVFVTWIKAKLGYDDALDAFGVHAVGGIIGAIGTGIFVNPDLGGTGVYDYVANAVAPYNPDQWLIQTKAAFFAVAWSAVSTTVILLVLKYTIGIRASEEAESEGLDVAEHGEKAYNF